jgi:hypothetical protein
MSILRQLGEALKLDIFKKHLTKAGYTYEEFPGPD